MIGLLAAGCGGQTAANPQNPPLPTNNAPDSDTGAQKLASPPATTIGQPLNANGEAIVARVNAEEITRAELERAIERFRQQQLLSADEAALQATVLDTLIDQSLIEQAAAAQQIIVSDAEVQAEMSAN